MHFDEILDGTIKAPLESEILSLDTEEGKKKAKAREKNEEAYCELVLSISTRESCEKLAFQVVKSSKIQDHQVVMCIWHGHDYVRGMDG